MGKRFAILIGVAATGVMALGAQTAAATPDVHHYNTRLTISPRSNPHSLYPVGGVLYHGWVQSGFRRCEGGRRVVLFKQRPGADRKLGADRSQRTPVHGQRGHWGVPVSYERLNDNDRFYAKVQRKVRNRFVCAADRSKTIIFER